MNETRRAKLHELLAVEQEQKSLSERQRARTVERFRNNQAHFSGMRRTFRPFSVDEEAGEVTGERLEAETRLVRTVPEELSALLSAWGRALNLGYLIDAANTEARADLEVEGQVLLTQVPATFLLQLEKRLRNVRAAFKEVPTFDPVRLWSQDPGADKEHVLRAEPLVTIRKQRMRKYNVMVEPTPEHPAQVDVVEVDRPVGEIRSHEWTGMISPRKKAELLERADTLLAAVKGARSRANGQEVDSSREAAAVLSQYLLAPLG